MTETIRDSVTTGDTPGAPTTGQRGTAGRRSVIKANPAIEYVAGGYEQWYQSIARVLPWSIDDVTDDFGDDLYERMLLDAQVSSVLGTLRTGVLEDGVTLTSAIADEDNPQYQQAADLVTFCERVLDDLDGVASIDDVLEDMLLALALGNRVAEQTYAVDSTYSGQQQLVPRSLKVKPRTSTAFVIDSYRNVVGLLGLIPGVGYPVQQGTFVIDPGAQPNILPREKFFILTNRPQNNDPRGTSLLRAAYDPWNQNMQLAGEYLKYLSQFASPTLIGITPENAITEPTTDGLGNPTLDQFGTPIIVTPEQALLNSLIAVRNGTALVAPFGTQITPLEMSGAGEAFIAAFDRNDRRITKAILFQTLATEEAEHGTRAQSQTHQDTLDTVKRQRKKALERALRRDVLRQLVRYNFGDDAINLTPLVSLGVAEAPDTAGLLTAASSAGYSLEPEQFPEIDEMIGVPVRPPEATERAVQTAELGIAGQEAGVQQQQYAAQNPPQAQGARSSQPGTHGDA